MEESTAGQFPEKLTVCIKAWAILQYSFEGRYFFERKPQVAIENPFNTELKWP